MPRSVGCLGGSAALRLVCLALLSLCVGACGTRTRPITPPAEPPVASTPPPIAARPHAPLVLTTLPPGPTALDTPAPAAASEPPAAAADVPREADCSLGPSAGAPIRAIALTGDVDPGHAPYPTNDSERFLFRQLYDTLVRVDCEGRVGPGLASSWRLDRTGPTWVLTLDERARFSDGSPVTTADVLSAWGEPGRGAALRPRVRRLVRSIVAVNARVIGITLHDAGSGQSLRALANPALAIARSRSDSQWPLGTTALQVVDHRSPLSGEAEVVTLAPAPPGGAGLDAEQRGTVRFVIAPRTDPRDQLDTRDPPVDLLVSRDPAVLAYAETLPRFFARPLPWLRTHVLLAPTRTPRQDAARPALAAETRRTLATDAVSGEARGAEEEFWWHAIDDCAEGVPYRQGTPARAEVYAKRVVFPASDPVARGLAARLVALTTFNDAHNERLVQTLFPAGVTGMVSTGLSDVEFEAALATGLDSGYLMGVTRRPFGPCQQARVLTSRAVWLVRSAAALDAAVLPLVDTRAWAIIRHGRTGVALEWDGALLLDGVREAHP